MTTNTSDRIGDVPRSLASSLMPALRTACGDRLGPIGWFKADWQRGGAATGTAEYETEDGPQAVVVKLPVVPRELAWMQRLQDPDDPDPVIPRLYACGSELGGYDLAWIVMERFPFGPLGLRWHAQHVPRIAEAAARFHAATRPVPVDQGPRTEDWDAILAASLENVRLNHVEEGPRWIAAIKALKGRLEPIVAEWRARNTAQWLHGDLHFANAMSRRSLTSGPVSLIDLAEVHAGHWIEDAVYLERQLWARPARLKGQRPVQKVAAARRALGLPVEDDYPRLAQIRRALLAASAPAFIRSEGHPRHLQACLEWLELARSELR